MIVFCCPKMINERSETELTWNNVKKIAGRVVAVIVPVAMQFLWYLLILKWLSKAAGLLSIVLTGEQLQDPLAYCDTYFSCAWCSYVYNFWQ